MNNYNEFLKFLENLDYRPKLLLHSCCGPCSSSVIELLSKYFDIDVYYYNPNIYPKEEYVKRLNEQERLLSLVDINLIKEEYEDKKYYETIKGLEKEPEGGKRCYSCIKMRMEKAAVYAKNNNYDFFTTTLSVSPHKNSPMINEIGYDLEKKYNIKYLYSDFKKKDGYKRSIFLSNKYNLYRQDYCGCKYSLNYNKKFLNK